MSLFGSILDKLGFDRSAAGRAPPPRPSTGTAGAVPASGTAGAAPASGPAASTPTGSDMSGPSLRPEAPAPGQTVDVMGKLESLAAANPQKLNWRTSIVDLLKLLGLDSSLAARKTLATELGCPPEKMSDSAAMNKWLHKTVLEKLAANGGNVPKELLH